MDIKETFNQLDNTKFNDFNNRLEGFEKLFKDKYYFTHPEDFSTIFSILVKYGKSTSKYILSKGEIYEWNSY